MHLIKLIGILIGVVIILGSIKLYKEAEKIELQIQREEENKKKSDGQNSEDPDSEEMDL
ncbi:hypothetical protein EPICR_30032 [Candidatus Desulfarcum epimagneticum]|uniref:Uncharacterized protein n=1 Tax=uncultured Desulfobacteraceae bacterium TaxID=218296 RepID=A0A484HFV5_9BACT|nr:hypothetical protein EPICR_30032 [uncultured Desulfobacteraceae bacterium]